MIKKVYSKIDPFILLNVIFFNKKSEKITEVKRQEITPEENFLQALLIEMPKGTTIKPHKHNSQERKTDKTSECALIFKGSVELSIYDLDNSFIEKVTLNAGDCSVIIKL